MSHDPLKTPIVCAFDRCGQKFSTKSSLNEHMNLQGHLKAENGERDHIKTPYPTVSVCQRNFEETYEK